MKDELSGRFLPTHNLSLSHEYGIWGNMIYRCRTETAHLYRDYGGRGISVCDEWLSFERFISDMGYRPTKSHSLDRIDVDGDYCKENCRWATKKEQSRNRRNSRKINVNGVMMQVDDYCDKFGVRASTIKNRIQQGWTDERIVNTPMRELKIADN